MASGGTSDRMEQHYSAIVKSISDARLIPFLGAGVNRCGRPHPFTWDLEKRKFLPDGRELAEYLQSSFGAPRELSGDLARVAQYVSVMNGDGPLYEELHKLFDADYPPTKVHRFLAKLPRDLREMGYTKHYQIIITTNYDELLERAFIDANEEYDLVSYIASGEDRGRILHTPANGSPRVVETPNDYSGLPLGQRTIILKIHGAVDRTNRDQDSYVITEDDYIEYLKHTELAKLIPATMAMRLLRSQFLFLGYGLKDWNLRVILDRISENQRRTYNSWAVMLNPDQVDERFWVRRRVEIINMRLEEYFSELERKIETLRHRTAFQAAQG
jgi:hypothetical protein